MKINLHQDHLINRIISNTLVGWFAKIIITISGIILTPILISGLGKYEYAIWILFGQLIGFILIADFGVANSVGRLISKYDAKGLTDYKISVYSCSLLCLSIVVLLISLACILLSSQIFNFFDIQEDYRETVIVVFWILVLNTVMVFPFRVGRGLLQSVNRYDFIDIVSTVLKLFQLGLILLFFFKNSLSLLLLAVSISSTNLIAELVIFLKSKAIHDDIKFKWTAINKAILKELFSIGGASIIKSFSALMTNQGLIFMVGSILGLVVVPIYSIPVTLLIMIGTFIGRIGTTFMPMASAYASLEDTKKIVNLSTYGFKYTFTLGLIIAGILLLYGEDLIALWLASTEMTASDTELINSILLVLIIPMMLSKCNQGNKVILSSTGYHWLVAKILFFSSALSVLLSWLLLVYTNLGLYAVVLAWSLKLVLADVIFILIVINNIYPMEKKYYVKILIHPLLCCLPVISLSIIVYFFKFNYTLIEYLISILLFSFSALLSLYFVVEKEHLNIVLSKLKNVYLSKVG